MRDRRRLALVIGSQCEALEELSFLPVGPGPVDVAALSGERRLLVELRDLLVDGPGDCDALTGLDGLSGDGLLLNPTAAQARAALEAAMSEAHDAEAVLVLHVLAHGTGRQADPADPVRHLLQVWDTVKDPLDDEPESRGWNPYADIKRRAPHCPRLAGLVLSVDTCRASWAKTAIDSWSGVRGGLLSAVLAASGDHAAWDACLTHTVIAALRDGVSAAAHPRGALVAELLAVDLEPLAANRCKHQTPHIGGYQSHNPVLYVGRNLAGDELARRLGLDAPTAGLILRLTRHYTDHAITAIATAIEENRVVSILGEAGTGKSTLAAALRQAPEDSTMPIGLVHAAAFVSAAPGVIELARSLAGQLAELPGFEQATSRLRRDNPDRWDTLDDWQKLIGPLGLIHQPVRLLIDGFDQLQGTVHERPLRRALTQLLENVEHASLVLTSRSDPGLPGSIPVTMPTLDDKTARRFLQSRDVDGALHDNLIRIANGRWLVLELAADQAAAEPAASLDGLYADLIARAQARCGPLLDHVLQLLAAAGTGPVLPVDVLEAALRRRTESTRAALFQVLGDEDLYRVIDRASPGTSRDHAGLFHQTLTDHLAARTDLSEAHQAIAEALDELAPEHDPKDFRDDPTRAYAFDAQASHWWHAGRPDRVVASLARRTDVIPSVNLARWQQWSERLQDVLGADHPDTLLTRNNIAFWTGQTGDARAALKLFEALLPDHERVLGAEHPDTLSTRNNIAALTGQTGDARAALKLFEALLPDRERVLGADHPDTLLTRNNIAFWTGETGDARAALKLFEALLPDHERVLGAEHPDTLLTRNNIAFWTGETGDARAALKLFEALLPDHERVLGAEHPDTLLTRSNIAFWTGQTGDARAALKLFEALLPDRERVLGADHPDTLLTRHKIAALTGETGDARAALKLFEALLPDYERVLGAEHPDTLLTRNNIAFWTGQTGDARAALKLFEALLPDHERVLGADHPDTLSTEAEINELRVLGGDE